MQTKRINIVSLIITGITASGITLLYLFVYPLYGQYFPKCLFYSFSGLYCPGCGTQRAITALLHGEVLTALQNNFLAIISLPFVVYAFIVYISNTGNKRLNRNTVFYSSKFVKLVLITVLIFGIARNIHDFPFNLLAPLN